MCESDLDATKPLAKPSATMYLYLHSSIAAL